MKPVESSSARTLPDLLRDITSNVSDLELGLWLMKADPTANRVPMPQKRLLIAAALADGHAQATLVREQFPNADPGDIAHAWGLPVEHIASENRRGDILYFADYGGKPPVIRIFDGSVAIINAHLAHAGVAAEFGVHDATPVFIAHEIYHHLDTLRPRPISQQHRVTTLKIATWRLTSGLLSLAEIAANAFAQQLLCLAASPSLFELIAKFDQSPLHAWGMMNELQLPTSRRGEGMIRFSDRFH